MTQKEKRNIYAMLKTVLLNVTIIIIFVHVVALLLVFIGVGLQGNSGSDALSQYILKGFTLLATNN